MGPIRRVITLLPIADDLQRLTDGEPLPFKRVINQHSGLGERQRGRFFLIAGGVARGNDAPKTSASFDDATLATYGSHNDPCPVPSCLLPARSRPASAARSAGPASWADTWPARYSRRM